MRFRVWGAVPATRYLWTLVQVRSGMAGSRAGSGAATCRCCATYPSPLPAAWVSALWWVAFRQGVQRPYARISGPTATVQP